MRLRRLPLPNLFATKSDGTPARSDEIGRPVLVDGTLLSSARTISPRNLAALQTCREANVELCIASARGPATIAMTVPPILRDTVWIVHNGAEAVKEGRRIHFRPLLPEAFHVAVDFALCAQPLASAAIRVSCLLLRSDIFS